MSFEFIDVNFNTENMKMDYFLKLGDDSPSIEADSNHKKRALEKCGEGCLMRDILVVSTTAQKVWFSVNTYSYKTMPDKCSASVKGRESSIYPHPTGGHLLWYADKSDEYQAGPYNFGSN